jgi:hypothetical protein
MNDADAASDDPGAARTSGEAQLATPSAPPRRQLPRMMLRTGITAATVYCGILVYLMFLEEQFIFFPIRHPGGDWEPAGLAVEEADFLASDGVRLHGWFSPVAEPRRELIILYSHGNAGNITHRAEIIELWQKHLGVPVFIYDYRGYGRSSGAPTESGVYADARAAYRWLTDHKGVAPEQIVLYGESIGAAVSLDLGLEVPHRALILDSAFTSAVEMGSRSFPWLPVRLVMRNRFDSIGRIDRYRRPLLVIHGTDDTIVPFEMGKRLFEHANEPKRFYAVRGADHNEVPFVGGREYFDTIGQFLDGLGQ